MQKIIGLNHLQPLDFTGFPLICPYYITPIKKEVTKRIIKRYYPHLTEKNKIDYNDKASDYKDSIKYRVKNITMEKFLHVESKGGTRYEPHIIDISYIVTLIYDDEQYQKSRKPFKNKIITELYDTLEVNELASIFLPFYDRENWEYSDEEFLVKHEKVFQRFLELQKYDSRSCLSDVRQFCIALYDHEKLPPIEKYDELIEIHKTYKTV